MEVNKKVIEKGKAEVSSPFMHQFSPGLFEMPSQILGDSLIDMIVG